MDDFNTSELNGRAVIDNRGTTLGQVADVAIDTSGWRVRGLLVDLEREVADDLHIGKSVFGGKPRLEIGTERIEALGENVILNIDADQIAGYLRRSE